MGMRAHRVEWEAHKVRQEEIEFLEAWMAGYLPHIPTRLAPAGYKCNNQGKARGFSAGEREGCEGHDNRYFNGHVR
jgi:hypothetical protein